MIRLLEFLWHGCWHQWRLEKTRQVTFVDADMHYPEAIYMCTKCNRFKVLKV